MAKTQQPQSKITKTQALQALLQSGYLLESRIESLLRERHYLVEANSVYTDPLTSKSRELDLYALSGQNLWKDHSSLWPYLLVECVNNPQPIAFLTKKPQVPFYFRNDIKMSGLPVKILETGEEESWEMLSDFLHMDEYHHSCRGRVASQFCSFNQKKGTSDWMAFHEDGHFDCIQKLCDAVDYFSVRHFKDWVPGAVEPVNLQIYYPIIVFQGSLFDIHSSKRSVRLYDAKHIQYRQPTIIKGVEGDYQIDIVTESYFPQFLNTIEDEIDKMVRQMRRHKVQIQRSIEAIVALAKKAKNEEEVLHAMKF